MPKKVKTKKQKKLTDTRRIIPTSFSKEADSSTFSLTKQNPAIKSVSRQEYTSVKTLNQINTSAVVSTTGYQFLIKDLRKTMILTILIVIVQLIINYFV
jgi:hypothetical protein